jgi:tellurite resistance protein TehA-like permease
VDVSRLIDPGYWFEGSLAGAPTPITYVVIAIFTLLLIAGLTVWLRRRRLFPGQRIKTRLAAQLGPWFVTAATIGLVSSLLRVAQFPILSARVIWLVCFVWALCIVGYVAWYWRSRYPAELARTEREEQLKRYVPRPRQRRRPDRRRR